MYIVHYTIIYIRMFLGELSELFSQKESKIQPSYDYAAVPDRKSGNPDAESDDEEFKVIIIFFSCRILDN